MAFFIWSEGVQGGSVEMVTQWEYQGNVHKLKKALYGSIGYQEHDVENSLKQ